MGSSIALAAYCQPTNERVNMNKGDKYNWKEQPERLVYLGKEGCWHLFAKIEAPEKIWCEVTDDDLHMLEETKA